MTSLKRALKQRASEGGEEVHDHAFWHSQPVPRMDEPELGPDDPRGPIQPADPASVPKEPLKLPPGFEWANVRMEDDGELSELYTLLNENYVEDNHATFRFDYSREFIRWAMTPPGWKEDLHVGVRVSTSKKLVAFIAATPADLVAHGDSIKGVEVNFLCVHKKLRTKRLAPVLIREVTRRCNLQGIFQAAYTAGVVIPKPVGRCTYYHRSLNPKKLIECGFSPLKARMTMSRTIKMNKLPEAPQNSRFRPLAPPDVPACCKLLNEHLQVCPRAADRAAAPPCPRAARAAQAHALARARALAWLRAPIRTAALQVLPALQRRGAGALAAAAGGRCLLVRDRLVGRHAD